MSDLSVRIVSQTPTVTAGGYTAKDAVGGLLTFADCVPPGPDAGAILDSVTIIDLAANVVELDLALFSRPFTATTDNAAFDPSDADALNLIGYIRITDWQALNDWSLGVKSGIGLPVKADHADGVAPHTTIYGQLMCITAPTYGAVTDLTVKLGFVRGD